MLSIKEYCLSHHKVLSPPEAPLDCWTIPELSDQKTFDTIDMKKEDDVPNDLQKTNLPMIQFSKSLNPNLDHETLWYLEFHGSVNKLGVGAGVWIHSM